MMIVLLISLFAEANSKAPPPTWPAIQEQHLRMIVQTKNLRNPLKLEIKSTHGKPQYRLTCGSFNSVIADFAFSGDFECQLQPVPPEYDNNSSLFAETDQTADWQTRARFLAAELRGACAKVPDFGEVRLFRLRGMRLMLALSNIDFAEEKGSLGLKSFEFKFSVVNEPAATSASAMPARLNDERASQSCADELSKLPH